MYSLAQVSHVRIVCTMVADSSRSPVYTCERVYIYIVYLRYGTKRALKFRRIRLVFSIRGIDEILANSGQKRVDTPRGKCGIKRCGICTICIHLQCIHKKCTWTDILFCV